MKIKIYKDKEGYSLSLDGNDVLRNKKYECILEYTISEIKKVPPLGKEAANDWSKTFLIEDADEQGRRIITDEKGDIMRDLPEGLTKYVSLWGLLDDESNRCYKAGLLPEVKFEGPYNAHPLGVLSFYQYEYWQNDGISLREAYESLKCDFSFEEVIAEAKRVLGRAFDVQQI